MTPAETREHILTTVDDLVGEFLYYGRKEDEDLPRGEIEKAVEADVAFADVICARFRAGLLDALGLEESDEEEGARAMEDSRLAIEAAAAIRALPLTVEATDEPIGAALVRSYNAGLRAGRNEEREHMAAPSAAEPGPILTAAELAAIERGDKIGDAGAIWLLLRSHRAARAMLSNAMGEMLTLRANLAASERSADRLRHGQDIEGDHVCPADLRADDAETRACALLLRAESAEREARDQRAARASDGRVIAEMRAAESRYVEMAERAEAEAERLTAVTNRWRATVGDLAPVFAICNDMGEHFAGEQLAPVVARHLAAFVQLRDVADKDRHEADARYAAACEEREQLRAQVNALREQVAEARGHLERHEATLGRGPLSDAFDAALAALTRKAAPARCRFCDDGEHDAGCERVLADAHACCRYHATGGTLTRCGSARRP